MALTIAPDLYTKPPLAPDPGQDGILEITR